MVLPVALLPHLVEVLKHPQYVLRTVGPVPRSHWEGSFRARIEELGGEYVVWSAVPPNSVAILTDLRLDGVSAVGVADILVEAISERGGDRGALEVSPGWLRAAERMQEMMEGIGS